MAFPRGSDYHADSDADDEFERSVMTSPTQAATDSDTETSSEPPSNQHTPTTFGHAGEDGGLPRAIISEWNLEECAHFLVNLNLRQYCDAFIENEIIGEALVALKHEELKEMGITSLGHRITILKKVYEIKVAQDVAVKPDDYVPLSAEQNSQNEMATVQDITRLARSIIRLRDERIAQAEAQLTKLADEYRKLRLELLPVFKMAKERSEPLPHAPYQNAYTGDGHPENMQSPPSTASLVPEKSSLTRTFSKKLGLSSSVPKNNNSPTHVPSSQIPSTIHEGRTLIDSSSLNPSAAATQASNQLSGAMHQHSPAQSSLPSPTSPMPYHQPLAPRAYQREPSTGISRYDGSDDLPARSNPLPTPTIMHETPKLAPSNKQNHTASYASTASTLIPSREMSASVPPHFGRSSALERSSSHTDAEPPSVEIFKSFRVALEDPCYKVLPAALRKYNIQADWRQYALYIVYGDQERCVGLEEKPLALFKDLDREGKKPMFMLRKLANPIDLQQMTQSAQGGLKPMSQMIGGMSSNGLPSSGVGVRSATPGNALAGTLPGGVL